VEAASRRFLSAVSFGDKAAGRRFYDSDFIKTILTQINHFHTFRHPRLSLHAEDSA
jgi:hypothetical protein